MAGPGPSSPVVRPSSIVQDPVGPLTFQCEERRERRFTHRPIVAPVLSADGQLRISRASFFTTPHSCSPYEVWHGAGPPPALSLPTGRRFVVPDISLYDSFRFLNERELANALGVCRSFHRIIRSEDFWQRLCQREGYGSHPPAGGPLAFVKPVGEEHLSWRQIYEARTGSGFLKQRLKKHECRQNASHIRAMAASARLGLVITAHRLVDENVGRDKWPAMQAKAACALRVWDREDRLVTLLHGMGAPITAVTAGQRTVYAGSLTGEVRAWDLETCKPLAIAYPHAGAQVTALTLIDEESGALCIGNARGQAIYFDKPLQSLEDVQNEQNARAHRSWVRNQDFLRGIPDPSLSKPEAAALTATILSAAGVAVRPAPGAPPVAAAPAVGPGAAPAAAPAAGAAAAAAAPPAPPAASAMKVFPLTQPTDGDGPVTHIVHYGNYMVVANLNVGAAPVTSHLTVATDFAEKSTLFKVDKCDTSFIISMDLHRSSLVVLRNLRNFADFAEQYQEAYIPKRSLATTPAGQLREQLFLQQPPSTVIELWDLREDFWAMPPKQRFMPMVESAIFFGSMRIQGDMAVFSYMKRLRPDIDPESLKKPPEAAKAEGKRPKLDGKEGKKLSESALRRAEDKANAEKNRPRFTPKPKPIDGSEKYGASLAFCTLPTDLYEGAALVNVADRTHRVAEEAVEGAMIAPLHLASAQSNSPILLPAQPGLRSELRAAGGAGQPPITLTRFEACPVTHHVALLGSRIVFACSQSPAAHIYRL